MNILPGSTSPIPIGPFVSPSTGTPVTSGTPTVTIYLGGSSAEASGTCTAVDAKGVSWFSPDSTDFATPGTSRLVANLTGAMEWFAPIEVTGEGSYAGILTVNNGTTGLPGATVNATLGGVLVASGTTDSNGQITNWALAAQTYVLAVRLSGYQSQTAIFTVAGNAWTKTVSLAQITITPPSSPELCTVQFRVMLNGNPESGAVCTAALVGTNQSIDGTILSNELATVTTNSLGVAELQLVQRGQIAKGDGLYNISIAVGGKIIAAARTAIPNQETILFEKLLK